MKIRALAIGACALVLPFGAAACGGGGEKPSTAEISSGLEDLGIPAEAADCMAKELRPDLSAKVLNAIAEGDEDTKVSDDEEKKSTEAISKASTACMSEMTEGLGGADITVPE